jgi:hypothetical protein
MCRGVGSVGGVGGEWVLLVVTLLLFKLVMRMMMQHLLKGGWRGVGGCELLQLWLNERRNGGSVVTIIIVLGEWRL